MQARTEARVFAALALVAVGIYFLSCKPAWSPEGDKVAYVFTREVGDEARYAVAIYDLTTKQSRVVVEESVDADGLRIVPIEVFWPRHGNELICVAAPAEENEAGIVRVSAFDLRTNTTTRSREIAVPGACSRSSAYPLLLQRKRWLWILGDETCFRVDLKKGVATPLKHEEAFFFGNGKRVFFAAEEPDKGFVFGRVKTLFGLKEVPLFIVHGQDGAEILPIPAMPSRRTRFACTESREETAMLRVFDGKGRCVKEIALPSSIDFDEGFLGAEWSPDGTVLWITVEGADDAGTGYTGIAEIDVARGSVRIIKVNESEQHGELAPLHLSLSPNGEYLACSWFDDDQIGLCLVDLRTDERPVTLMAPPAETVEMK